MNCKICKNPVTKIFNARVLNKYSVDYFNCNNCGFVFTEKPYWLKEAYERPINLSDTGILQRNISFSKTLTAIIILNFNKSGRFLDYAGGYGIFTRLMRDIGFDFFWHDPYTQNIFSNGFESDLFSGRKYELLTAFEVFEHLENPLDEIFKMKQLSDTIVFSTEIIPDTIPQPGTWWYYGFEHGQHISFYSERTLAYIAKQFKLNHYRFDQIHILSEKKINSFLTRGYTNLNKIDLFKLLKRKLVSKTFIDHDNITKSICKNNDSKSK